MEYTIRVRVPDREDAAFRRSTTGVDDDVILAAEHAIRARVEVEGGGNSGIELEPIDGWGIICPSCDGRGTFCRRCDESGVVR